MVTSLPERGVPHWTWSGDSAEIDKLNRMG